MKYKFILWKNKQSAYRQKKLIANFLQLHVNGKPGFCLSGENTG